MNIYIVDITHVLGAEFHMAYRSEEKAREVIREVAEIGDTITLSRVWLTD